MSALVIVVGPSGVGKDSILQYAAERLTDNHRISFVRRTITRPAESGGELHHAVDDAEFTRLDSAGHFAVTWQAHDLKYGIPCAAIEFIAEGGVAVVNGSRYALEAIASAFPQPIIVSIIADQSVIAERLRSRGRENENAIAKRLTRPILDLTQYERVYSIDNSGTLEVAGEQMISLLRKI